MKLQRIGVLCTVLILTGCTFLDQSSDQELTLELSCNGKAAIPIEIDGNARIDLRDLYPANCSVSIIDQVMKVICPSQTVEDLV